MKVRATLKNLRITPRKVRLVTHALIGVDTREALIQLQKLVKKSSDPIFILLKSAVANATNNFGLDGENLYIFAINVGDGLKLERWLPRAFGRATPLLRRGSNVTIILEERIEGKNRTEKKLPIKKQTALKESEGSDTEKNEQGLHKNIKPESKKETLRGNKSIGGKVVKKLFQRKAT